MHKVCASCGKLKLHHGRGFCQQCYRAHMKGLKPGQQQISPPKNPVASTSRASTSSTGSRLSVPVRHMETRSSPASTSKTPSTSKAQSSKAPPTRSHAKIKASSKRSGARKAKSKSTKKGNKEREPKTSDDKHVPTRDIPAELEQFSVFVPLLVNRLDVKCLLCYRVIESEVACKYSMTYCGNCYFATCGTKRQRASRAEPTNVSKFVRKDPVALSVRPVQEKAKEPEVQQEVPEPVEQEEVQQNAEVVQEDNQEQEVQQPAQPPNPINYINVSSASEGENYT